MHTYTPKHTPRSVGEGVPLRRIVMEMKKDVGTQHALLVTALNTKRRLNRLYPLIAKSLNTGDTQDS